MKKLLGIFMVLILTATLCACSNAEASQSTVISESISEKPVNSQSESAKAETAQQSDMKGLTVIPQIGPTGDYFVFEDLMYCFEAKDVCCYNSKGELVSRIPLTNYKENDLYDYNDGLYPTEDGIIYWCYNNGAYTVEAYKSSSEQIFKLDLSLDWGELRSAVSDNNNGLIMQISRSERNGGGLVVLHINKNGEIIDINNMVASDSDYVNRHAHNLAYNSKTGDLYGDFREDDHIDNKTGYLFKMNLNEDTYKQIELDDGYGYIAVDESTGVVYSHSHSVLMVWDKELNLIREHTYEYCQNVFPLSDGRYMVYHSGEGFHEGHTVDIYNKDGKLLTQVDLGYNVLTIMPFEKGFVAQTSYLGMGSVFKYDYSGNLLCEIPLDTDDTYCHIYDYNTVFCSL